MTDHPRFQSIDGEHEDRHRHYYGAPAVDLVLGLLDWWLTHGSRATAIRFRAFNVTGRTHHDVAQG